MCKVIGHTRDQTGVDEKTWHVTALPTVCDDDMIRRRLRNRHFVYFGSVATDITWEWVYCNEKP